MTKIWQIYSLTHMVFIFLTRDTYIPTYLFITYIYSFISHLLIIISHLLILNLILFSNLRSPNENKALFLLVQCHPCYFLFHIHTGIHFLVKTTAIFLILTLALIFNILAVSTISFFLLLSHIQLSGEIKLTCFITFFVLSMQLFLPCRTVLK